jgi:hypothetical protein
VCAVTRSAAAVTDRYPAPKGDLSMQRSFKRFVRIGFALALLVLLPGCDLSFLNVQIPDFDSNRVQGIWIWRQSELSGQWERDTRIDFADRSTWNGLELVSYVTVIGTLGERGNLPSGILRDPTNSDRVTVSVGFIRLSAPGQFRVSTWNAYGDSPLSTDSALL